MPDRTGQQLGTYRLLTRISTEATRETYLGGHVQTGVQVTLQVAKYLPAPQQIAQFLTEASRLEQLAHPSLVRILAYGEAASTIYLALNYTAYKTLHQHYPRGRQLVVPQVVYYIRQIAEALQYAHNNGITHGSLGPESLLLGSQQTILVNNFSLAGLHARYSAKNLTPYTAPEQIRETTRPASDQYALAAILYEWLGGAPPYADYQAARPLSELAPQVPANVEQVVMRGLEKDWRARFESVSDLSEALQQAITATFVSRGGGSIQQTVAASSFQTEQASSFQAERATPTETDPDKTIRRNPPSTTMHAGSLNAPPPPGFLAASATTAPGSAGKLAVPPIQYPIYPAPPVQYPIYPVAQPVLQPAQLPQPRKLLYFPVTRRAPLYLQIFGMLLYGMLIALSIMGSALYLIKSYIPGSDTGIYTNLDGSVNVIAIVLTVALVLVLMPAASLFCGVLFGSWRGLLVSAFAVFVGGYITHLSYTPFWSTLDPLSFLIIGPFPLTALLTGLIYEQRKFAGWGKSFFTIMLGCTFLLVWFLVLGIVIDANLNALSTSTSSSGAPTTLGITWVLLGLLTLALIVLITIPVAIFEGIIHTIVASASKKSAQTLSTTP